MPPAGPTTPPAHAHAPLGRRRRRRRRRFLNSGAFVGTAAALARMVEAAMGYDSHDDQRAFVRYFLEHPGEVCLDHGSELFLNLYQFERELRLAPGTGAPRVPGLGTEPQVLHGNGTGGQRYYEALVAAWRRARGLPEGGGEAAAEEVRVPPAPFDVGAALFEEGAWAAAAAAFLAALQADAGSLDAQLNLGLCFSKMGMHEVALEVYIDATRLWQPGPQDAFLNAGICAVELGDPGRAETIWKEGLDANPSYAKLQDALDGLNYSVPK